MSVQASGNYIGFNMGLAGKDYGGIDIQLSKANLSHRTADDVLVRTPIENLINGNSLRIFTTGGSNFRNISYFGGRTLSLAAVPADDDFKMTFIGTDGIQAITLREIIAKANGDFSNVDETDATTKTNFKKIADASGVGGGGSGYEAPLKIFELNTEPLVFGSGGYSFTSNQIDNLDDYTFIDIQFAAEQQGNQIRRFALRKNSS